MLDEDELVDESVVSLESVVLDGTVDSVEGTVDLVEGVVDDRGFSLVIYCVCEILILLFFNDSISNKLSLSRFKLVAKL